MVEVGVWLDRQSDMAVPDGSCLGSSPGTLRTKRRVVAGGVRTNFHQVEWSLPGSLSGTNGGSLHPYKGIDHSQWRVGHSPSLKRSLIQTPKRSRTEGPGSSPTEVEEPSRSL